MSKVKVVLDTRSIKKDGTSPIKLRVCTSQKTSFYISLGLSVKPDQFSANGGKDGFSWVHGHPSKGKYNNYISRSVVCADEKIIDLVCNEQFKKKSTAELKSIIHECIFGADQADDEEEKPVLFIDVFDSCMNTKNPRSVELFNSTKKRMLKVMPELEDICLDDVTKNVLSDLQTRLQNGNSVNSSAIHLRNIRCVFNYALDEELTTKYPFRKFKIQTQDTKKRSLTDDQLFTLINFNASQQRQCPRDIFMLIFYLIGINISDLVTSQKSCIYNGRFDYRRLKTGKLYSIKIEPEAQRIIDKYSGNNLIVNLAEIHPTRYLSIYYVNYNLKRLSEEIREQNEGFPTLTTYWARHTWATIAHKIGISKDVISMALGHSFGVRVTDTYIDYDADKIDQANRMVIDYVNNYKKETPTT